MRFIAVVVVGLLFTHSGAVAQQPSESDDVTVIYFVRHAEVDPAQPTFPLNHAGRLKADALARAVSEVRFTHVFSSHTTRARQMVEPVALARNLPVQQLPMPGTQRDWAIDRSRGQEAGSSDRGVLRDAPGAPARAARVPPCFPPPVSCLSHPGAPAA